MSFGLEQEGGSLNTPMALAHPFHPINSRSKNKRRNLWVGRCVSSWWPLFPSRNSVDIYLFVRMHSLYEFCYGTYVYIHKECRSVLVKLHPIVYRTVLGECTVPVLNATFCFLGCFAPGPSFGISDSTWRHRSPLCHIKLFNLDIPQGSIRLCNWLSLRRLVSWINHLPPLCLSTFWKSTFKQQLGCRFDR